MLADNLVYPALSLLLLAIVASILCFRKDLAKHAFIAGMFGGVAGFIAEVFYSQDYWTAPVLFGFRTFTLENFLFGFSITALCVCIYPFLSKTTYKNLERENSKMVFLPLFFISLCGLVFLVLVLRLNSVVVSSLIFTIDAAVLWLKNPVYIKQSLVTAGVVTPLLLVIYLLIGFAAPDYLEKYWHLYHTTLGIRIFTHVPLLELIWYFSWALFGSIGYSYLFSKKLIKLDR